MKKIFTSDEYIPSFGAGTVAAEIQKNLGPKPLYMYRSVVNTKDIMDWAKGQGFTSLVDPKELHVTVAYSKAPVDWFKIGENYWGDDKGQITVNAGGPRAVEQFGEGAIVLVFGSEALQYRNMSLREYHGASWDYDAYYPHITLTYEKGDLDLENIEPYTGKIVLGPEIFEDIESDEDDITPDVYQKFDVTLPIEKSVEDQRLVFGWAYVSTVGGELSVDHSGDVIDMDTLEKAFYDYAEHIGISGENHEEIGTGKMVECMVFSKEKQDVLGIDLGKEGVWVGYRLNETAYAKVKSGELRCLSIGGRAKAVNLDA